ncbi:hypothetical protein [Enterobacter quasiroggenkampii]|uniref:hypothetical protein n=1 Tax=Enterobacter quasiroggenkampii TaxID=2497436 RepID=UPI0039C07232
MSELRAGGLAIVISAIREENIGKSCRLIALVEPGKEFSTQHGVKTNGSTHPLWFVEGDLIAISKSKKKTWHGWSLFHPKKLMPIDGEDFSHEDQRQKELTNG